LTTHGNKRILSVEGLKWGDTWINDLIKSCISILYCDGILGYCPLNTFLYNPCISNTI
jgi:hypothetical protein